MRRLGFLAKELKKKFSLVKAQRGLFGFVFFFQFDKRTDKRVTQLSTQPLWKGTLTLHELIIYMLNFCALSFMH